MKAIIEIHRSYYPDVNAIHLEKTHNDLNVLRHWQDTILNKQGDNVLVVGSIDGFEAFIRGRKSDNAPEILENAFKEIYNYINWKLQTT